MHKNKPPIVTTIPIIVFKGYSIQPVRLKGLGIRVINIHNHKKAYTKPVVTKINEAKKLKNNFFWIL